jgi:hypothetical protein
MAEKDSLAASWGLGSTIHCRFEGVLKFGEDRPPGYGRSEVHASEFSHKGFPHSFATLFK